jgi:glycosyltransferase involved in cell wall biosynthesis
MYTSLKKSFEEVEVLGPVNTRGILKSYLGRIIKMMPFRYNLDHSFLLAFLYARAFKKRIPKGKFDVVFAPRASTEIALLNTTIPIIYFSDTTFKGLYNYYEWFSNFSALSVWEGNKIEKLALKRSAVCVFSSAWAGNSAINDYEVPPQKVHIVQWGPNLDSIPIREDVLAPKTRDVCKLLFVGVEWERKGGAIAYEAFKILKNKGYNVKLTICGCPVPPGLSHPDMEEIPYINKNIPEENYRFHQMMLTHHFFILPTRAECYGMVFAEASAYALPIVTTDTGGIESVVKNGINGFRLPLAASGQEYATTIENVFFKREVYEEMRITTRNFFEDVLHWDNFSFRINEVIAGLKKG